MKVKIVELFVSEFTYDGDCYDYITKFLYNAMDCSDWEEVDDEELEILRNWVGKENNKHSQKKYMLAIESNLSAMQTVKEVLEAQAKLKAKQKKDAEKHLAEAAAKSKAKKQKQLERLKKELGV